MPSIRHAPRLLRQLALVICLLALNIGVAAPRGVEGNGLRFVDGAGTPLAGATVRVLCFATALGGTPRADFVLLTGANGAPPQPLPADCNFVAALRQVHLQPSSKPGHGPAFTVYTTSWAPGSTTLQSAAGDVALRDEWPLVLFHVTASLEWQPAPGSAFSADLRDGLRQASAYLYDLTEGQMALGPVTIAVGGSRWEGADLRFLAANDYRPTAFVGGIVPARTAYTSPATSMETVFAPGEVYLGRYWDGADASNAVAGNWTQPNAARTLVHEWGHYALFLYDEYQNADGSQTYCVCPDLPNGACEASAMSYHYTASELWAEGQPSVCLGTDQWQVHGEQDWTTLRARWSSIQGLPVNALVSPTVPLNAGPPLALADVLFGQQAGFTTYLPIVARFSSNVPPLTAFEPGITLTTAITLPSLLALNALYPQVYVSSTLPTAARLVYQGTSDSNRALPNQAGAITLLGVQSGDRARVFVDQYALEGGTGARYLYAGDAPLSNGQSVQMITDTWGASLDVDYGLTGMQLTAMTVTLTSPVSLNSAPVIQLCTPEAAFGCPSDAPWRKPMAGAAGAWTAAFTAATGAELPHYGLLRVAAPGAGEIIRWFQLAGGVGPAHMEADAPLLEAPVMAEAIGSISGQRNRVGLMPAADYAAVTATLPAGVTGIVGVPIDVDVLLPGSPGGPGDHLLPLPVRFTVFYSQAAIDRLGIAESDLILLHYRRAAGVWGIVLPSGSNTLLNWLASPLIQEDGLYAVGWIEPGPPPTPSAPSPPALLPSPPVR